MNAEHMHKDCKLIADTFCDVYTLLEPWIDDHFWDFETYDPAPGSICVVGRNQAFKNPDKFRSLCDQDCQVIFANSAEGSSTQISQLQQLGIDSHVRDGRILLLTGGRMPDEYAHLVHEHFFVRVLAYDENLAQMANWQDIFHKTHKPYKFLFLNGRTRPHRKYLWHRFCETGLLDQSIWTMMESRGAGHGVLQLSRGNQDLMIAPTPVQSLPAKYEVPRYKQNAKPLVADSGNIKFDVFNNQWGEIYLELAPYMDTYFSLVTETVLEYPYSFFTEKIAKPLAIGHPWIAATNRGFYRDLHNLGFRTFGHVIDESFDQIDNDQSRMERIVQVTQDLCSSNLVEFLSACKDVCKYNQQHLREVVEKENNIFPQRFFQFVDHYG
jgi:hypothetical protein